MDPPKTLSDYELRRLETILRNKQMLSSLVPDNLRLASPQNVPKRPRNPQPPPSVIRRSLRCRGIPPPSDPPSPASLLHHQNTDPTWILPPICKPASGSLNTILSSSSSSDDVAVGSTKAFQLDPRSELVLRPENVSRIGDEHIYSMRFLPLWDRNVIVAGDGNGSLGLWYVDSSSLLEDEDGEGIYLYRPHSNQVSGISVHPCSSRKIFTSSIDGTIKLMDIEKEMFDMLLSSEHSFYSICQCPQNNNSLFIGEGRGFLKFWDEREGKASVFGKLHGGRINTLDINPENTNLMATSSTDGLCCIWDLRIMKKGSPANMKSFSHYEGAVQSAYFSPSGKYLATTITSAVRSGGGVGIASGANFDDLSVILQTNWICRWPAPFRAIWGWDDSYIFMGAKNKEINVISTKEKTVTVLQSSYMTSISCRFAVYNHLNVAGYLAGAGRKVYLWTKQ